MRLRSGLFPLLTVAFVALLWLPSAARADRILMTGCFAGASSTSMVMDANAALSGAHTVTAVEFSAALPATITTANYDRVYLNAAGNGCSAALFTSVQNFVLAGGDLYIAVEFDVGFGGYTEIAAMITATTTLTGIAPVARPTGGTALGQNNEPATWVAPLGTCPVSAASAVPTGAAAHFSGAPTANIAILRTLSSQPLALYFDERTLRSGAGRVFAATDTTASYATTVWRNTDAFLAGTIGFGTGACEPVCGNGAFDGAEQCDDGNSVSGDGCTSACRVEAGYVCRGARSVCAITCGDGVLASTEACDDGNTRAGDGCSTTCTAESGWSCANRAQSIFVSRRGLTDCRESATIAATPFAASDSVSAVGAGRWRARYVGGIVEYSPGSLFTAGYLAMTQSDGPPVLLNGGCSVLGSSCVNGPRTSAAAELAFMLSTPAAELYDFTSINATTSVALWDNGCFNNSNATITYRFDTVSECTPVDFCQYEFRAPVSASFIAGGDTTSRAPSVLFDRANLLPTPVAPNSVYRGAGLTDTLAPRIGSIIRFTFAAPRTLSDFYLWQNYNPETEGLTQFGLTFRAADGSAIGAERTFATDDCDCTRVPSERFTFPAMGGVTSVDLRIIASENSTYAHLVEVLFGSAPSCNDGIACTTDSCSAGTCSAVALPAGTGGVCTGTNVCSGGPTNACVACVSNAQCAGMTPYCNTTTNACVACLGDVDCNDGNECTTDACAGSACVFTPRAVGALCATGFCDGSASPMCVACVSDMNCADGNACTTESCALNACVVVGVAAGTPGLCADGDVCSGPMASPMNACVECVADAQCSGATPLCSANVCVPCASDFGGAGLTCPMDLPLCVRDGATAGTCIRCTSNNDCTGNPSGPICDTATGSCGNACVLDTDCTTEEWCTASRVCSPTVPNGMPIPSVGPANGMCTSEIGTRVCVSEVCFEADDLCGLPSGEPCTTMNVCRSAICAPNGSCGECDANDDCDDGRICNVPTGMCVTTDAGVMRDAGASDAGSDGGLADAGASDAGSRMDAGRIGGLAGGAFGCVASSSQSTRGLYVMLGMLALVVVRRRRPR